MFCVNNCKIRIYNTQNISYNFVIIIVMQKDNIFTKKKNNYKYFCCFLKYY